MKNKTKAITIILVLSAFIMAISFGGQKAEWKGKIELKDEVKVVKNPKKPMYGKDVFSLEEELSIGEAEGREEYMFSEIQTVAVDEEENIYVVDEKECHIKVFGKNGEYFRTIGKKGQGPGEIGGLRGIQLAHQKELMVNDIRNRRISFFSTNGEFIRSINMGKIMALRFFCDSKENYIVTTYVMNPPNTSYEIKKFDSNFNLLDTIATIPGPNPSAFNPFLPIFYCKLEKNDNIIYGYPEDYELQIINPEGKVIKKIVKEYDPVEVTEEEKEEYTEDLPPQIKLDFSKDHSAYSRFTLDDEGRIFVQTWEKEEGKEGNYHDVFDREGRYIAKIFLKTIPHVWKNRKLYTIEEDEDGYQFVKRYKVIWEY
jgi:hypothetical protein